MTETPETPAQPAAPQTPPTPAELQAARAMLQLRQQYGQQRLEHASDNLRDIIAESAPIKVASTIMVLGQRLYAFGRDVVEIELKDRWEVDDADLVCQVSALSSMRYAAKKFKLEEMIEELVKVAVPFVQLHVDARDGKLDDPDGSAPESDESPAADNDAAPTATPAEPAGVPAVGDDGGDPLSGDDGPQAQGPVPGPGDATGGP